MDGAPVQMVDLGAEKGHALVTTRPLKKGEIVFTERPLLCCQLSWNRFYGHRCCDYCLKPLENPQDNARRLTGQQYLTLPDVPSAPPGNSLVSVFTCPSCKTEYCCETCLIAARNDYHAFTCCEDQDNTFNRLEECWRACHPMPETGTVMLLVRIAAAHFCGYFLKSERAQHIVMALSRFVSSPVVEIQSADGNGSSLSLAHRLLGPTFSGDLTRLHGLFLEVLTDMVGKANVSASPQEVIQQIGLQQLLTEYGFCSAMCLIGRNGQGIGSSSLGSWGKAAEKVVNLRANPVEIEQFSSFLDQLYETIDETAGEFLNVEGVGLYEHQSLINHSCQPNASICFESGTSELTLIATEDIASPGTELTICYLDECMMYRGVHSRRKYLREHYLFICKCPRCVEEKELGAESVTTAEDDEEEEEEDDDDDEAMDE
ncbi:hypothetical protein Aperf_G00000030644 [Anoplocephala perfoliata]